MDAEKTHLTWFNVGIGFAFVLADAILSKGVGLGIGSSLLTAAIRCVLQLSVMGLVLKSVFETDSPWAVAGVSCLLVMLGSFETVVNKSKFRFSGMFPSTIVAIACSTIPVSILGTRFAMSQQTFWTPDQYIPVLGMLCGSTISGIVVSVTSVLRELHENKDKIETYLAFGASRYEACRPIATEALRLALTPTINQMSVIGLISIPGMMTGAILGGSSVEQAAKLQMVIMFMINASTTLASIIASVFALSVAVDDQHRIRGDRIFDEKHIIWKTRDRAIGGVVASTKAGFGKVSGAVRRRKNNESGDENGEREPLLG